MPARPCAGNSYGARALLFHFPLLVACAISVAPVAPVTSITSVTSITAVISAEIG